MNKLSSKKDPTGLGEVIGRVKSLKKMPGQEKFKGKLTKAISPRK
jgi:hypothetical protein